ncbi:P-loop ATPase, Sll1717 family [Pseudomonas aeruginosa]|uniref:P-loop ATPase, Sll1717 family n=1 Tax=Pseudomonas aeruginosa TaxID=287 RepID=UPI000AC74C6A|nr:hypothetical protein [Pseudomonas aeruginosa]MBV5699899.1 hypothetical protein [Pseudomonas aeruginosa]MCQ9878970.1 hypothetical protein [Pseudomonas aeruginosa]MDI2567636.1 hypothetical protein [Pseudomonas aeruginosa]HBP5764838.1 hypothetical protein [Pseudomonas aeruginosa]HBP6086319.1 hypothetical protein [Pseudomonas aeruginosa]
MDVLDIATFGEVAAEDDNAILDYFVETASVNQVVEGNKFLILGRKGAGKTALFRYFNEAPSSDSVSLALNLRGYPWSLHAKRADGDSASAEQYEASWRFLIATEFAQLVVSRMTSTSKWTEQAKSLIEFFTVNYGGVNVKLDDVLRPRALRLSKASFEPTVLGCKLGSIALERQNSAGFSKELNALTDLIFEAAFYIFKRERFNRVLLHFDELDQGMVEFDQQRQLLVIGLILACRKVNSDSEKSGVKLKSIVYLRSDMWDDLIFSDKNKITRTNKWEIDWTNQDLNKLVDLRIRKYIPNGSWGSVCDDKLMRGRQVKFAHIVARTFKRPRDVISFLNSVLERVRERAPVADGDRLITNKDVVASRPYYSRILKSELDDEIKPHWKSWDECLRVISGIGLVSFTKDTFVERYEKTKLVEFYSADEALKFLYEFSVIGYYRVRSGYGGSEYVFKYEEGAGWDEGAIMYKVHLGLKEFAGLTE